MSDSKSKTKFKIARHYQNEGECWVGERWKSEQINVEKFALQCDGNFVVGVQSHEIHFGVKLNSHLVEDVYRLMMGKSYSL